MTQSAYREAVWSFEQALCALPHLPEERDTLEQAIDLRLALRSALIVSGDWERALAYLREAETLSTALDDQRRLGRVSRFLARSFQFVGAYDQAIIAAQRALALTTASGEAVLHALANQTLGNVYAAQGDYRQAIDCFRQNMAFLEGAFRHERFGELVFPAVFTLSWLACCYAELGAFAEGRASQKKAVGLLRPLITPIALCMPIGALVSVTSPRRPTQGASSLERAVDICQEAAPAMLPWTAAALGAAYTLGGRVADAVPLLAGARTDDCHGQERSASALSSPLR